MSTFKELKERRLVQIVVSYAVGGAIEVAFSVARKEEVSEGFLVTGLLFGLIVPATVPIWVIATGVAFGVVFGKEIFGGTGRNVVHPMLLAWAFLFVSYPATLSGEGVWVPVSTDQPMLIDLAANGGMEALAGVDWTTALIGLALSTYNVADPSFFSATTQPPMNLLGAPGAILADALMRYMGLGAWVIVVIRLGKP